MTTPLAEFNDKFSKHKVWKGKVPISFELSEKEQNIHGSSTFPYYIDIPRTSFLSLKSEEIQKYFSSSLSNPSSDVWFEINDTKVPLKWQFPIGVLYDLFSSSNILKIIVHLSDFPERNLLKLSKEEDLKKYFMNELKQATYIKRGDVKPINNFGLNDVENMWKGLKDNDFDLFWKLNESLFEEVKTIPIRMFKGTEKLNQYPAPVFNEKEEHYTLGNFIEKECSEWCSRRDDNEIELKCKVIIQGINPPMDTPLLWLSINMSHPDNFLYIIVLPTQ